jgi:uncharacterized membrane protein YdjX (TVP38/TMEM64 family)
MRKSWVMLISNYVKQLRVSLTLFLALIVFSLSGISNHIYVVISGVFGHIHSSGYLVILSICLYIIAACTVFPTSILSYLIGSVFHYPTGIIVALISNYISCVVAFYLFSLIYRWLGIKYHSDENQPIYLGNLSTEIIAYAALALPFSVLVSALTSSQNINFRKYCIGMIIGTTPSCLLYSSFGALDTQTNIFSKIVLLVMSVLLITMSVFLKKRLKSKDKQLN